MKSKKPTRAPTLEDVARSVGLSPMTVSRTLNTPQPVRPETVKKVMQAVQATGYIPNALADDLTSKHSKLVAVVIPQANNNMSIDTIQALSDTLAARGYHMLLCVAGYDWQTEAELVSTLFSRRLDDVVLTDIQHAPLLKKAILSTATPVVEIWDLTPTPLDMLVGFSHEKMGKATNECVLRKGYQRPGLPWAGDVRAILRKQGLCARLAKKELDDAPQVEIPLLASLALGRRGLAELFAVNEFDMIICSSDILAQGAIMEAEDRGLCVPQDLTAIDFGDLDFAASNHLTITAVSVDRHTIGEQVATLLADRIERRDDSGVIIDIDLQLVARESAWTCLFRA